MFDSVIPGIGTFINTITQNSNVDKQIDFQREQNELAYQRALQLMNFQNVYNSPKEQVKRLREAGLNPNLAYGSLGNSSAAPVPSYSPVDGSSYLSKKSVLGQIAGQTLNNQLLAAQIKNINADTTVKEEDANKISAEATSISTYNKYIDAIQQGVLKLQGAELILKGSESDLNDAKTMESFKTASLLSNQCEQIQQMISNAKIEGQILSEDLEIKKIERAFAEPKNLASLNVAYANAKYLMSSANLSEQQFKEMASTWVYKIRSAAANANIDETNVKIAELGAVNLGFQNGILQIQVDEEAVRKQMLEYQHGTQQESYIMDYVLKAVDTFGHVLNGANFVTKYNEPYQTTSVEWDSVWNGKKAHNKKTGYFPSK